MEASVNITLKHLLELGQNGSFNTSAGDTYYGIPKEFQFLLLGIYSVTCLSILLGNGFVCYTNVRLPGVRSVTNMFIISVSITDIVMTVFCVPFTILSNLIFHYWPFWAFLCPLIGFLQMTSVLMRSFTLIAMTCDMYYTTARPLKPHLLTKLQVKILLVLLLPVSCVFSLPPLLFSHIEYMPYEPGSNGLCLEIWPDDSLRSIYGICIMMLQYFIPLIVMTFCYIHIGIIVWAKQIPGEASPRRDERRAVSKKKTIKMIIIVIISFLLAWLPIHVITIIGDLDKTIFNSNIVHMMWLTAHWVAFSNSGVNPLIYFWMNSKFRKGVYEGLQTICCCKKNNNSVTLNWCKSIRNQFHNQQNQTILLTKVSRRKPH
ncbi:RYamide receptor-like [Argopecten irradians]|uniref:RYamide receptor-like n=1 Tax=Argopecten irradians TaxID=31199 RepID=UPI00371A8BEC